MTGKFVVVTTEHKGVFFGKYERDNGNGSVTLTESRNCLYWHASSRGVFGLAANGPQAGSRVGPKVPRLVLHKVTSIAECTKESIEAWGKELWS